MRISVEILPKKKKILIPFDHQYYLASYIYRTIEKEDPEYALELHKPKKYKFFTFSYLTAKKRKNSPHGLIVNNDKIRFLVSSPKMQFVKSLINGMLSHPEIKIHKIEGTINEIKILKEPEIKSEMKLKTLSPIIVRKPVKENGKLKSLDLYPTHEEFSKRLADNLKKKFEDFYKEEAKDKKLEIGFLGFKPKRHKINNTFHRCVLGEFLVKGNKELIRFGYECGFGEKNSMGFGMVKVIKIV